MADDQACYPKAQYSGSAKKKDASKKKVFLLVVDKDLAPEAFNFTPCQQMLSCDGQKHVG